MREKKKIVNETYARDEKKSCKLVLILKWQQIALEKENYYKKKQRITAVISWHRYGVYIAEFKIYFSCDAIISLVFMQQFRL